jgi:hypothetical protein
VVVAVAHRVILQPMLQSAAHAHILRNRRGAIELIVSGDESGA